MATEVQALDDIFEVRVAGDSPGPWKRLVCEIDNSAELDNETSEVDTKCGTFTGVKEMKGTYSGNAVSNAKPLSTEASYKEVIQWQKDKTLLDFRNYNEAAGDVTLGEAYHHSGQGRFTNSNKTATVGDVVQFAWTFTPTGEIELDAIS